ncbi:MAG: hypothetical protein ACTHLR_16845 [Rhizomicrobium sp.]
MRILLLAGIAASMLASTAGAFADPVQINDSDEGYSRLARWEQHLDDRIADGVRNGSLDPMRAWRIQKRLDNIEARVVQSYYESDNGIDYATFRRYADQLRDVGRDLGEEGWGRRNVYGDGWYASGEYNNAPPMSAGPPQGYAYYRQGDYEQSCRQGNAAAGTIFGALAGGLIGGAASHGKGGAIAGGVILGGILGNALSRDVDCDDQRYAFASYGDSLNGDLNRRYTWQHGGNRGSFMSTREYRRGNQVCRDFHSVSYREGGRYERDGTACRRADGYWETR